MLSDDDVVPAARLPVGQAPVMSRLRHVVGALKSDARQIFNAGLAAVQPGKAHIAAFAKIWRHAGDR